MPAALAHTWRCTQRIRRGQAAGAGRTLNHVISRAPAHRRQWSTRERTGVGLSWKRATASGWPAPRGSSSCQWPVSGLQALPPRLPASSSTQWLVRSVRNAHLLTVAGAAQVGAAFARLLFPVSPKDHPSAPSASGSLAEERPAARSHSAGSIAKSRCYDCRMLEEFELLAAKVAELARLVQSLRAENQQLRAQLATATGELDAMRMRVDEASRRLDGLMERLPALANPARMRHGTPDRHDSRARVPPRLHARRRRTRCSSAPPMWTARCRRSALPAK